MTDTTHNSLVTMMIIIAIIIAIVLFGRHFSNPIGYQYQYYQQANALGAFDEQNDSYYGQPVRYTDTVTAYSRPSRYTSANTTYYSDSNYQYESQYSYTCQDGYCWTNQ